MKPIIVPAILTGKFEEFEKQIKKVEGLFPYAQVDIMDGKFVSSRSFEVEKIYNLNFQLPIELHLMVNDPISEMKKWKDVKQVFRIIFHVEAESDLNYCIRFAEECGWESGIALNPETPINKIEPYLNGIKVVQFMTVHPGKQGAKFQLQVIDKIKEFTRQKRNLLYSVDGGVNKETIKLFPKKKINIFNVGSALFEAADLKKTTNKLLAELN